MAIRRVYKDVEQETIDVARVFQLLSEIQVDGKSLKDTMLTEWGKGYVNSFSTFNEKFAIVPEYKYEELKKQKEELEEELKSIKESKAYQLLNKFYKYVWYK